MIDVQQVRELAEILTDHSLTEIRLRQGDASVILRKGPLGEAVSWAGPMMQVPSHMQGQAMAAPAVPASGPAPDAGSPDEDLVPIASPMVGTFYASPDPDAPPFLSVGMDVEVGMPVCIIEAMKVFNEIKAEVAGRVERVLAKNEQAVEYGQPLFLLRPRS